MLRCAAHWRGTTRPVPVHGRRGPWHGESTESGVKSHLQPHIFGIFQTLITRIHFFHHLKCMRLFLLYLVVDFALVSTFWHGRYKSHWLLSWNCAGFWHPSGSQGSSAICCMWRSSPLQYPGCAPGTTHFAAEVVGLCTRFYHYNLEDGCWQEIPQSRPGDPSASEFCYCNLLSSKYLRVLRMLEGV